MSETPTGMGASIRSEVVRLVRRLSASEQFFQHGDLVVVAVSGGQDSVCLLDVLAALRAVFNVRLHVAYVDHRLRGRESADDARFTSELAGLRQLPFTAVSVDVPGYRRRHRLSTQVAARYARYQALARLAGELGAASLAVGHTRDDVVETFSMNLLRGAGLRGLGGITPRQELRTDLLGPPLEAGSRAMASSVLVVRPLLEVERIQTSAYCRAIGVEPRADPTNLLGTYLRNRVRAELLPHLARYRQDIRTSLSQTAAVLRGDWEVVERATLDAWERCAQSEPGRVVFRREAFMRELKGVQRHLIRLGMVRLRGTSEGLGWAAVDGVLRVAASGGPGKRLSLSAAVALHTGYDTFELRLSEAEARAPAGFGPQPLSLPGRVTLGAIGEVDAALVDGPEIAAQARAEASGVGPWEARLDADKLAPHLHVRTRRPGDRMRPLGSAFERKLQDILVDAKVPREMRDHIPLVDSPNGIVWLAGVCLDDRFKLDESTSRIAILRFSPGPTLERLREG